MLLPDYINKIIEILDLNNIESYVVGGCVRDYYLGLVPYDYDMCVGALPDKVSEILGKYYKIIPTGIKHGTLTVFCDDNIFVEITSFRKESGYSDFRHPDKIEFTDKIEDDLKRRDFTVNAMAYNPKRGLIDLFGGLDDIKNGYIKAVGDPIKRFTEDALRMIRAIRFSSQTGFKIEKNTYEAIFACQKFLKTVAGERVQDEFRKLFKHGKIYLSGCETIVADYFPNLNEENINKANFASDVILKFYYLLKNCSEADFKKHVNKLKFSSDNSKKLCFLKKTENDTLNNNIQIKKYLSEYGAEKTELFLERQKIDTNIDLLNNLQKILNDKTEVYSLDKLNINGNDIADIGYKGKNIGKILNLLLNIVINDKNKNSRDYLLSEAKNLKNKEF